MSKEKVRAKKVMTEQDKKELGTLYTYIKDLLGFDADTPLPRTYVLRLKGLQTGKYIENYNIKAVGSTDEFGAAGNVSFGAILLALKLHRGDVLNGFARNNIEDCDYKFAYMCKVIENNLQQAVELKKRLDDSREMSERTVDPSVLTSDMVDYKTKKKKDNPYLSNLW